MRYSWVGYHGRREGVNLARMHAYLTPTAQPSIITAGSARGTPPGRRRPPPRVTARPVTALTRYDPDPPLHPRPLPGSDLARRRAGRRPVRGAGGRDAPGRLLPRRKLDSAQLRAHQSGTAGGRHDQRPDAGVRSKPKPPHLRAERVAAKPRVPPLLALSEAGRFLRHAASRDPAPSGPAGHRPAGADAERAQ